MNLNPETAVVIDELIEELMKDRPNLIKVKTDMISLGLKYSEDPLERMNTLLLALHPNMKKEKSSKDFDL